MRNTLALTLALMATAAMAAILDRLLRFCTSVELDNTASRCVRRRSCP